MILQKAARKWFRFGLFGAASATRPSMNACDGCAFFVRYERGAVNQFGRCHRRAPTVVEVDELVAYGNPDQFKRVVQRQWPEVRETDGCGEWQQKQPS